MAPANTSPEAPDSSVRSRSKKAAPEEVTIRDYATLGTMLIGVRKMGKTRMGDPGLSTREILRLGEPVAGLPIEWNMGGVRTATYL